MYRGNPQIYASRMGGIGMNGGRVVLVAARAYSLVLVLLGLLTVLWVLNPSIGESPQVAGLWFAVGGFGLLIALTFVIVQLSR